MVFLLHLSTSVIYIEAIDLFNQLNMQSYYNQNSFQPIKNWNGCKWLFIYLTDLTCITDMHSRYYARVIFFISHFFLLIVHTQGIICRGVTG